MLAASMWILTSVLVLQTPASARAALEFDFFRTRVEPIFLKKREGRARCYVCHSRGTWFRLQPLSPGSTSWNEEQSQKNFEAAKRMVKPSDPMASRLLSMPLSEEAGGAPFHPGGRHFESKDDPEWKTLDEWVRSRP